MVLMTNADGMYLSVKPVNRKWFPIILGAILVNAGTFTIMFLMRREFHWLMMMSCNFLVISSFINLITPTVARDAGFGGFTYTITNMRKEKHLSCKYDCSLSEHEQLAIKSFICNAHLDTHADTRHYVCKCYYVNKNKKGHCFVSDTNGEVWTVTLNTDAEFTEGDIIYTIGDHIISKAYLDSIEWDYDKYNSDKNKYITNWWGKVIAR